MFTQGRTILVAALALAMLGAGPAMAKPGGAGPGATAAIEALETRVDTIEGVTPGGVTGCAAGEIAKSDGSNNWTCQPDDDTTAIDWDDLFNLPAGFNDDTDNDKLEELGCADGKIAKRVTGAWSCEDDDDTTNTAWGSLTGVPTGFDDDIDNDKLEELGCADGKIAKRVSGAWSCEDDDTGGGGGSPFTLMDSDGPPVAVGTVVDFDVAHRIGVVRVITLLTNSDISGILMSGEKIVLPVVAGAFANVGAVFFTGLNCSSTTVVESSAGFLDTILPAVVVGGTLYVASTTTVASSTMVMSSRFDDFACQNFTETISNTVEVAPEGAVSGLFTTPFVLGGGP